jgi:hypothetical protein
MAQDPDQVALGSDRATSFQERHDSTIADLGIYQAKDLSAPKTDDSPWQDRNGQENPRVKKAAQSWQETAIAS